MHANLVEGFSSAILQPIFHLGEPMLKLQLRYAPQFNFVFDIVMIVLCTNLELFTVNFIAKFDKLQV